MSLNSSLKKKKNNNDSKGKKINFHFAYHEFSKPQLVIYAFAAHCSKSVFLKSLKNYLILATTGVLNKKGLIEFSSVLSVYRR